MVLKSVLHIILFLTAFGLLYHDTVAYMVGKWLTTEGSHGPLIVAVILYLLWGKRKHLNKLPKTPALIPGALLLGLGCFMLFSGKISSTMLVQQISLVPTLLGAIGLFWGLAYLKALLVPVGYLLFLRGFMEQVLGSVAIFLQQISAWIAAQFLMLYGMPVFLSATVLELPHISLEVVRACSGISHIVGLMALAVPLAMKSQKTPAKKCILVSSALLIGIIVNGLRIALIGLYSQYDPAGPIHGPRDTLNVSFVFILGMTSLVVLSHLLSRVSLKAPARDPETANPPLSGAGNRPSGFESKGQNRAVTRRFAPIVTALAIFVLTLGFVHLYRATPVQLKRPLETFPTLINGFTAKSLEQIDDRLRPFSADEELIRVYEDPSGKRIDFYIGYFEDQDREKKVIDYRWDWMHEKVQQVEINYDSATVMINKTLLRGGNNPDDIYFWYFMDGRIITNRYIGKLATFWGALAKRKTNAAIIIVRTKNGENAVMPFLGDVIPIVHSHLTGD